jgi:hypothetical protein
MNAAAVIAGVVPVLALGGVAYVSLLGSNWRQPRVDAAGIRALEDALAPGHADVDATFRADEPRGTGS